MDNLLRNFERYLHEALGIAVKIKTAKTGALPFYLQDAFTLYELQLFNLTCLLAVPRGDMEQTPFAIKKYLQQIQDKCGHEVIYLHESISAYNRKRLIEQKVSFVVPGNQLYLPLFCIDLREHFKRIRTKTTILSPSGQAVVLYVLYHDIATTYTPLGLSKQLGYTPMTMTRALNELESVGLGDVVMEGKERVLRIAGSKTEMWEKALTALRSPVKKSVWTKQPLIDWRCVRSGLTALAHYSQLAEPKQPVFAISQDNWKKLVQSADAVELPCAEPDACLMEVWSYNPCLFATNDVADPLSLYLSMKDDKDERVVSAVADMMKEVLW